MSRMMYGQPKDVFRPQRAMSSIMDLSSSSLMSLEQNSISKRSHLTGGEPCRWYRTLRAWDLPLFRSDRGIRI